MVLFAGMFVLFGALLIYRGNIRAGKVLHYDLLTNVLASPMSFFDTTPLGRTINRFGKDLDVVDVTLPMIFHSWLACVLKVVAVLLVISISTPPFIAVILPLALVYFLVQVSNPHPPITMHSQFTTKQFGDTLFCKVAL